MTQYITVEDGDGYTGYGRMLTPVVVTTNHFLSISLMDLNIDRLRKGKLCDMSAFV